MAEEEHTTRASDEDYDQYIVHYEDIPQEELAPGAWSHLVAGNEAVVSFLTIPAGTYFPVHQHVAEQIMVVVEGYIDQVIDGKIYRVNSGDVIVMPSNVPHGGYVREQDCRSSIFSRRCVRTSRNGRQPHGLGWRSRVRQTRISGLWVRTRGAGCSLRRKASRRSR